MTSSIPETMTAIAITEPGGPEVLGRDRSAGADARRTRDPGPCRGGRRQPAGHAAAAGRLSAAARAHRQRRGSRSPAGWRWSGRASGATSPATGSALWSPGGGYAEYCVVARGQCAAGAAGPVDGRGGRHSRDLLHRLDQCIPARAAQGRRDASCAMAALERHRHDGDPAGAGQGGAGVRHRRHRPRSAGRARRSAPSGRSITARRISSRSSNRRQAARAPMSFSTWWAATTLPATSRWPPCTGASSTSPSSRAPRSRSTSCR